MLSVFITHLKTEETEDRTDQYYEVDDVDIILYYFLSSVQIYTLMAAHKQDFLEPLPTSSLQNHMTTLNNFPFTLYGGWKKTLVNKWATVPIFMPCIQMPALH